jgi:hypothetical protein
MLFCFLNNLVFKIADSWGYWAVEAD